jgi:hypothetical protein
MSDHIPYRCGVMPNQQSADSQVGHINFYPVGAIVVLKRFDSE